MGYMPPVSVAGATPGAMAQGAANLVAFDQFLTAARPGADVTWICHSYGSLVCASALPEADPDALVLVGSPGVGVSEASELSTEAPVWAGETGQDLIKLTQLTAIFGGSFGVLPSSPAFGARTLPCEEQDGHSGYFRPGSAQVTAMAAIILGERDPAT
jgi:pimeloyl-ACP methyl ester carboxylesterase